MLVANGRNEKGVCSSCPFRLIGRASLFGADERNRSCWVNEPKKAEVAGFHRYIPVSMHPRNRKAMIEITPAAPWLDRPSHSPRRERKRGGSRFDLQKSGSATDNAEENVWSGI